MHDNDLKRNGSGYYDPTAYAVMKKIESDIETERFHKLLNAIFDICELSDFHIEERLIIKDKRTGRVWR